MVSKLVLSKYSTKLKSTGAIYMIMVKKLQEFKSLMVPMSEINYKYGLHFLLILFSLFLYTHTHPHIPDSQRKDEEETYFFFSISF